MAIKFRNKKLFDALMERKAGAHDPKAGKQIKRAKQAKQNRREERDMFDGEYYAFK